MRVQDCVLVRGMKRCGCERGGCVGGGKLKNDRCEGSATGGDGAV